MSENPSRISANQYPLGSNVSVNRRTVVAALALAIAPYQTAVLFGADTGLTPRANPTDASDQFVRVKSVLELKGTIQVKSANEGEKVSQPTPIESRTNLEFEEAIRTQRDSLNRFAVQLFSQAESVNDVQKHATTTKLRDECRTIVRIIDSQSRSANCLDNPLTASERDLVQGPISTIYLDLLLPNVAVELGDRWQLKGEQLAKLLNFTKVTAGGLKVTLVDLDSKIGQLEFAGDVEGDVQDIKTTMKIDGKARVDRASGLISWVALTLHEKRQINEIEPGFDITARVRILREGIESLSQSIDLAQLQRRAHEDQASELTRVYSKLGAYQFVADRGWTIYTDSGVDASLRWIQKNHTFAQCTLTNLTDTEPGQQLSIAGYQDDIQKSMGKQLGQMLEATERVTNTGLRMMRVVSIGTLNQVPMQWIHILVSNDAGRHLSLVFTMNAASSDRFESQDLQIADTLEFTLRELPSLPKDPTKQPNEKQNETAELQKASTVKK